MEEQINELNEFIQSIRVNAADVMWRILAAIGVFILGIIIKILLRKLMGKLLKLRTKARRHDWIRSAHLHLRYMIAWRGL